MMASLGGEVATERNKYDCEIGVSIPVVRNLTGDADDLFRRLRSIADQSMGHVPTEAEISVSTAPRPEPAGLLPELKSAITDLSDTLTAIRTQVARLEKLV